RFVERFSALGRRVEPRQEAPVQAKLAVNEPGDRHEQEADRVADAVTEPGAVVAEAPSAAHAPVTVAAAQPAITPVDEPRESELERDDHDAQDGGVKPLAKAIAAAAAPEGPPSSGAGASSGASGGAPGAPPDAPSALERQLATPRAGTPLADSTRRQLEPRLGAELGHVRVHTDADAARMNDRLSAVAFTHGSNIYFSPGAYNPSSRSGLRLLAHELTHVVQQSGGHSGGVARTQLAPSLIQRAPLVSGNAMHKRIQDEMLKVNSDLTVEAPIPGGTGDGTDPNSLGFADFYTSSSPDKVPWVRGHSLGGGQWEYGKVSLAGLKVSLGGVLSQREHPRNASGKSGHEPEFVDAKSPFKGDFPDRFKVGELKPVFTDGGAISAAMKLIAGAGITQRANYWKGFEAFTKQAVGDNKASTTTKGGPLGNLTIPAGYDYKAKFKLEGSSPTPTAPNLILGDRRVWIAKAKLPGIYVYFDLPHPYQGGNYAKKIEEVIKTLFPIRNKLGQKQKSNATKIGPKRRGAPRRARKLQRDAKQKTDWGSLAKSWEKERSDWDDTKAKPFLTSTEGKAVRSKVSVDEQVEGGGQDQEANKQSKEFKSIELWSGTSGKLLGALRFKLGPVFDKIIEFIDWCKEKFTAFIAKVKGATAPGTSLSWVKTVVNIIFKVLKTAFAEALNILLEMFRDCLNAIISDYINEFVSEVKANLKETLEREFPQLTKWVTDIYVEFNKLFKDYEEVIKIVVEAKQLINDVQKLEFVIRGMLQVVACLEPPALGCLWGLVAQVGLPAIIDLVGSTDLFQDGVVKPLIKPMLQDLLKDSFNDLIFKTMDAVGLGERCKKVCMPLKREPLKEALDKAMTDELGPAIKWNSPEMRQKVGEWEKKHRDEAMNDILKRFKRKGGAPATEGNIDDLIKALAGNKTTGEQLKKKMNESLDTDLKVDVDKLTEKVKPPPPKYPQPKGPLDLVIPGPSDVGPKKGPTFGPVDTPEGGQVPGLKIPF
ncbi:MAG TPA: DUF4157 domain-containing protein, partial [Polyangia bacterium]|nr:DUF4157 domain-containing protein [Polyangia bacterium]